MIDQATIDRILDAAQIVDVVSEFVTLRKAGVNYKGLCPFHNEKTPSFVVSPSKGLCKCFSCGKGGNAVHFIMEHEQMTYVEALKFLAKKYNIEIKERELTQEERQAQSLRESLFIVNQFAAQYFQDILHNHADGQAIGMGYFRQRGFRDDIIRKFQLGFSLEKRDALAQEAQRKGYKPEYLVKTGLCYETDDHRIRDRFWGRVIFPVHTLSGKVVAFGGRVLKTDAKTAKYVNSPESEIYHKSSELYGIYFAKQAIVKQDRCFLVEGYTDVISMHQAGIENVVASSGTSLTSGQIRLIHRFTNNITVLYDGDRAGIKASIRGIDMLLEEGMNIKVVLLPDGDDPDSFARKHNATEYQNYIEAHQVDFIRFKTNLLLEEAGKDPIKRAGLIQDIVQSISVIPEAIVRTVYIHECSQLLQVDEKLLVAEVGKRLQQKGAKEAASSIRPAETSPGTDAQPSEAGTATANPFLAYAEQENAELNTKEQLILQILIRYGEQVMYNLEEEDGQTVAVTVVEHILQDLQEDQLTFHNALHRTLLEEAKRHIHDEGFVAERYFLTHPSPEISRLAADLVSERYQLSKYHTKSQTIVDDKDRLCELVPHLLADYKIAIVKEELDRLLQQLKDPNILSDETQYIQLMKRYQELSQIQSCLAKRWGDRVIIV
ncbi:MAG: DNA primase [Bacteroidaceae bacterium]